MQVKVRITEWGHTNWIKVWYMFCFLMLGVIDQRRGSALGTTQMIFSNGTGLVMALMLVPSLDMKRLRGKVYIAWTPFCVAATIIAWVIGAKYWTYTGQWISGVLNITLWSYIILYVIREWRNLELRKRIRTPFFWCIIVLCLLMQISRHEGLVPLWYLMIFGGFYLVGIQQENRKAFFQGMLNGFIAWFFVQQTIAFGFRPYDYVRYRGLYSGETQNGLFYLIVYCTFLLKWIWAREERKHWLLKSFYFIMSAGSISFMIFTGGRAPLVASVAVTVVIYTWYEIVHKKSFFKWMLHGGTLLFCIVLLFPAVYGCIRYLPTILHHPIWFQGEYTSKSVCSFDAWDSPKYVSFENALETNVGRLLEIIGIDCQDWKNKTARILSGMKVHAAEIISMDESGSSKENPLAESGEFQGPMDARKVIYAYYFEHLNWSGHSKAQSGFYITETVYIGHSHNVFLQTAYDYGIPAGLLFLGMYLYSILQALWKRKPVNVICVTFLLAIGCFGFAETVWVPGQITVVLMWIMFYFVGEDSKMLRIEPRTEMR